MRGNIIRKILVILIIFIPVFSYSGCKKQPKCGCGKDVLYNLTSQPANIYWTSSAAITFTTVGDPYSQYSLCNPSEMYPNLKNAKSGDVLLVSGHVYWDCTYVMQSSNSSSQNPYKSYQVQVTDMTIDLYGKGKTEPVTIVKSSGAKN